LRELKPGTRTVAHENADKNLSAHGDGQSVALASAQPVHMIELLRTGRKKPPVAAFTTFRIYNRRQPVTFLIGFTLTLVGGIVGFLMAALAASSSMSNERAAHERALRKAVERGNDIERKYIALLATSTKRKQASSVKN